MKVSKKVGRRSRSSISRRRLRNKKSGYRKKHTQRGGKRGKCTRTRSYKRGRRFHRGGAPGNDDDVPVRERGAFELPQPNPYIELRAVTSSNNIPFTMKGVKLDYKRTDSVYGFSKKPPVQGMFDVEIYNKPGEHTNSQKIKLLRHNVEHPTEYDKQIIIDKSMLDDIAVADYLSLFTDMRATKPDTEKYEGTYTFPTTDLNKLVFKNIHDNIHYSSASGDDEYSEEGWGFDTKNSTQSLTASG